MQPKKTRYYNDFLYLGANFVKNRCYNARVTWKTLFQDNDESLKIEDLKTCGGYECATCRRRTNHANIFSLERKWEYYDDFDLEETTTHSIRMCLGCEQIAYHRDNWFNMADDPLDTEIFPIASILQDPLDSDSIPKDIVTVFNETIQALDNNQRILCGVGLRATIELLLKQQGFHMDKLHLSIERLRDSKILPLHQVDLLHRIKIIGNSSIHEFTSLTHSQLSLGIQITKNLIESFYVFPAEADNAKLKADEATKQLLNKSAESAQRFKSALDKVPSLPDKLQKPLNRALYNAKGPNYPECLKNLETAMSRILDTTDYSGQTIKQSLTNLAQRKILAQQKMNGLFTIVNYLQFDVCDIPNDKDMRACVSAVELVLDLYDSISNPAPEATDSQET